MVTPAPGTRREMLNQMTGQYTRDIIVDAGKCTGCMDCVDACKQAIAHEHPVIAPVARITIREALVEGGVHLPLLCRNCAEAPCVTACMTGCRIRNGSGWVVTAYERCVGCWMCVMSCPFGAIEAVHEEALARKCDGCTSYEVPPCVTACEPRALRVEGQTNFAQGRRRDFATRVNATLLGM
ncbi:MAG: 4Fe-4S dicluster domain-containing protein [Chloroflexi bacterium]|nr:4Fe-4S dicluster domain-containing protein [Chloroflexota bacterium]